MTHVLSLVRTTSWVFCFLSLLCSCFLFSEDVKMKYITKEILIAAYYIHRNICIYIMCIQLCVFSQSTRTQIKKQNITNTSRNLSRFPLVIPPFLLPPQRLVLSRLLEQCACFLLLLTRIGMESYHTYSFVPGFFYSVLPLWDSFILVQGRICILFSFLRCSLSCEYMTTDLSIFLVMGSGGYFRLEILNKATINIRAFWCT